MIFIALLLGILEPTGSSIQTSSTATQAPAEPSRFPIVHEIDKIGGSGSTLIGFDIDKNGKAYGCNVLEPSGSTFLDEKACETVMDKAKFRPTLDDKGKPVPIYGKTLRIRWNIED
jgi:TonB family protein